MKVMRNKGFQLIQGEREEKRLLAKRGIGGMKRRLIEAGMIISYTLVAIGIWVLVVIYGPIVKVEATYQARSLAAAMGVREGQGAWGWILPNFSTDTVSFEFRDKVGIVIPNIYIKDAVVLNVDATDKAQYMPALRKGIAHAAGTSLPGVGGLGYYFAHSSGLGGAEALFNAKFYLLGKLTVGDEVQIYRAGERFDYRVIETKVTEAEEVSFLDYEGEVERIVLQTCWPVGTSAKRLLVTAERV
jgi:sortase A